MLVISLRSAGFLVISTIQRWTWKHRRRRSRTWGHRGGGRWTNEPEDPAEDDDDNVYENEDDDEREERELPEPDNLLKHYSCRKLEYI